MKNKVHKTVIFDSVEDVCFNSGGAIIQFDGNTLFIWIDGDASHQADLEIDWATLSKIAELKKLL